MSLTLIFERILLRDAGISALNVALYHKKSQSKQKNLIFFDSCTTKYDGPKYQNPGQSGTYLSSRSTFAEGFRPKYPALWGPFVCADVKGRYIIGPVETDKEVESRAGEIV
jgi:hypothetical protein